MESELSGIFRVKLVTKNIVRGSPGTQFMHMRVKDLLYKSFKYLNEEFRSENLELLKQKDVYPYEYMHSFKGFSK